MDQTRAIGFPCVIPSGNVHQTRRVGFRLSPLASGNVHQARLVGFRLWLGTGTDPGDFKARNAAVSKDLLDVGPEIGKIASGWAAGSGIETGISGSHGISLAACVVAAID